jgi:hypothetical protein
MFHSLSDIISRYVCILSTIDSPSTFQYVLLSRDAKVPKRATQESAGYDIYSPKVVTIPARSTVKIPLDLSITPPPGTYVRTAAHKNTNELVLLCSSATRLQRALKHTS